MLFRRPMECQYIWREGSGMLFFTELLWDSQCWVCVMTTRSLISVNNVISMWYLYLIFINVPVFRNSVCHIWACKGSRPSEESLISISALEMWSFFECIYIFFWKSNGTKVIWAKLNMYHKLTFWSLCFFYTSIFLEISLWLWAKNTFWKLNCKY